MGSPNRVSRAIWRLVLVLSALACAPQASAAFFLDLAFVNQSQVDLVLKSDAESRSRVEGIEVVLLFDSSLLTLAADPEFKTVLTGPDLDFASCGHRRLPTGFIRTNCSGFFLPARPSLESGELLGWSFDLVPGSPPATLSIMIRLGESGPIELSQTLSPVPEATASSATISSSALPFRQARTRSFPSGSSRAGRASRCACLPATRPAVSRFASPMVRV